MKFDREVALLLPVNSQGKILIQDRAGHKPPPWGFFGGAIDNGETALEAVIRESKEELGIDLSEDDLIFLGEFPAQFPSKLVNRHMYVWKTEQTDFKVLEGRAAVWMDHATAKEKLDPADTIDLLISKIKEQHE